MDLSLNKCTVCDVHELALQPTSLPLKPRYSGRSWRLVSLSPTLLLISALKLFSPNGLASYRIGNREVRKDIYYPFYYQIFFFLFFRF